MAQGTRVLRLAGLLMLAGAHVLVAAESARRDPVGPRGLGDPGALVELSIDRGARDDAALFFVLRGPDARRQLVVTGHYTSGQERDLTRDVAFALSTEGVVRVEATGLVTPLADGEVTVTATAEDRTATATLRVERLADPPRVSFPNQVTPVFTKLGCNAGGCHGKSGGQNGFALSLLGFYPEEDYEYLVEEARGRRVFPAAPAHSLLLLKATGALPHGGGARTERGSWEYRTLERWIRQGLPYGSADDPRVERIEVFPRARTMDRNAEQQLTVFAYYTDGVVENVTPMAQYEVNDAELAQVSASGLVRSLEQMGDVAVMVRYQGQVDVFRATVPLGVEVTELPPERNFIDALVFKKLRELGLPPSPPCDDANFVRRVTVDICGRLPTVEEVTAFLESTEEGKRDALIERLLASPEYAEYFANKWSAVLRNKRENDNYTRGTFAFHDWIRESLYHNRPFDEFVRDILVATGEVSRNPPVVWYRAVRNTEERVEDAAQLFLGLRIKCARCHHHPFEKWSQSDYYGFAAFFSQVGTKRSRDAVRDEDRVYHRRGNARASNPRSGESLKPTGLGDAPLELAPDDDPRQSLVDWMARPDNPFFAASLVNRYWKHFFGRGLVEPEDDMRETNPACNPELLDAVSKRFIESGFDLKELVRTICRSSTYQLSSEPNEYNAGDKQNFSRFYPKRLNAEVLYDAVYALVGASPSFSGLPQGTRAVELPDTGVNNYFLTVFGRPMANSSCECERSSDANLAQCLHLLNSKELQERLADGRGRAAALVTDDKRDAAAKVRELYHRAYAREPLEDELHVALEYLERKGGSKEAFEDVIWALLNTKEFLFNH